MSQELAVFPIWVESPTSTAITDHQLVAIQEAISMKVRSTFMGRFALAKSQLVVRQPFAETDYRGANDAEAVVAALVQRTPHSVWVAVCPDKSGKLTASIESASTPESPKIDINVDNAATASTFQIYTSWAQLTSTHCGATNGDVEEKKTIKDEDDVRPEEQETPSCNTHLPALLFHKYLLLRRERQTSSDDQLRSIPCPFDEHHEVSFVVGIAKDDANDEAAAARDLAVRTHLIQYHMEDCVAVVADFMLRHDSSAAVDRSSSIRRRTQHKRPRDSTSSSNSSRSSTRSSSRSSSSSSSSACNRHHTHSQKSGGISSRAAPFGGAHRAEPTTVSNSNVASSSFMATNAPSLVETFTANAVTTGREQLPLPPVPDMTSIHFSAPAGIPLDCSLLLSTIAQEVGGSHHIRSYRHVHSKNCTFVDMSSPALAADCIARWWPHHSALVLNNGVRLRCNWAKNQPPPAPFSGGAGGGAASSNQQQHYQHNNIQATASLHSPSDHGVPDLQQQAGGAYFQPPPPPQQPQYAQQPVEGSSYLPPQYSAAPPYAVAQHNNNHNNTPPVYLQQQHQQQQQQPVKTPSSLAVLHLSPDIDVSERVAFLDLSRYGVVLNLKLFPEFGRGTVIFKDPFSTKALLHSISEAGGGWLRDVSDGFVI